MADALKPCRWCDGTEVSQHSNGDAFYWVQCNDERCLAEGPIRTTETDAIAAWNRRAPLAPPTEAEVEAAARTIASNRGWDWEGGTQPTTRQQLRDDARAALAAFVAGKTGG